MSVTPSLESVRMNSAITEHNENTSCEPAETSPFYWSESKISVGKTPGKTMRKSLLPCSAHTTDNQSKVEVPQDLLKCATNDILISLFSENCFYYMTMINVASG